MNNQTHIEIMYRLCESQEEPNYCTDALHPWTIKLSTQPLKC